MMHRPISAREHDGTMAPLSVLDLLSILCFVLSWIIPNHYPPWTSFYHDSFAAVGVGLLACSLLQRRAWVTSTPTAAWIVMAIAVVPWAQWMSGLLLFSGDAVVSSLYLLGTGFAVALGYTSAVRTSGKFFRANAVGLLLAALVSSFIALMQSLMISGTGIWMDDPMPGVRPGANLSQANNLATLIGFGLASLLLLYERWRLGRVCATLCLAVLITGLAVTQSRTALLFGPAMLAILWIVRRRGVNLRLDLRVMAIVIATHWLFTLYFPTWQEMLLLTAPETLVSKGIRSPRLTIWPYLLAALLESPWKGFGWLQIGAAELVVAERHRMPEFWMHAHNILLELLLWCGIPLGIFLSSVILYWFGSRLMKIATLEAAIAMAALVMFGIHSMLELPYHYAYFLVVVGLFAGQIEHETGHSGFINVKWIFVPAIASLVLLGGIWKDYPGVESDFRLLRFETLRIGSLRASQPAPDAPFLSGVVAYVRAVRVEPAVGMTEEELVEAERVAVRYPYVNMLYRLAVAQALNGQVTRAKSTLAKLERIHGTGQLMHVLQDLNRRIDSGELALKPLMSGMPKSH